jgi:hypothetical protein
VPLIAGGAVLVGPYCAWAAVVSAKPVPVMAVSAATIATADATAASSRGIDFRVIVPSRPFRIDDRERVPAGDTIGTGLTEPLQRLFG